MVRNLRHLSRCDECTHCHQAPITWGERRTKPQITKDQVRRVLNETRGHSTEVVSYLSGALLFGLFVERQEVLLGQGQLVLLDAFFAEYVLGNETAVIAFAQPE